MPKDTSRPPKLSAHIIHGVCQRCDRVTDNCTCTWSEVQAWLASPDLSNVPDHALFMLCLPNIVPYQVYVDGYWEVDGPEYLDTLECLGNAWATGAQELVTGYGYSLYCQTMADCWFGMD